MNSNDIMNGKKIYLIGKDISFDKWFSHMQGTGPKEEVIEEYCFPNEEIKEEFIKNIHSYEESFVKKVLKRFLYLGKKLGSDDLTIAMILSDIKTDKEKLKKKSSCFSSL